MKRVVFNQKGGVGKTSITCNLAAAFARAGRRTLVIDLDAQANASQYLLGPKLKDVPHTVADFFEASLSFKLFADSLAEALVRTEFDNLFLIPAGRALAELQPKLEARYKVFKLRDAVAKLVDEHRIDDVFFDTPPARNFYSMSALMAADRVLVPFDCDAFSADALEQVMEVIEEVRADHAPELCAEGVVINHFQPQAKLPEQAADDLKARGYHLLTPYLSTSIVMRESHGAHAPLAFYRPKHKLTDEFRELAAALMGSAVKLSSSGRPTARSSTVAP